ncbi:MAG TPA: tetratricopeptide repeat protein [Tepidisphaeraceae bacterium]|jgi:TPR repeat protein
MPRHFLAGSALHKPESKRQEKKIIKRWMVASLLFVPAAIAMSAGCNLSTQRQAAHNQLLRKANDGDAQAMYEVAIDYQGAKFVQLERSTALHWLEKAAQAGSTRAMHRLGYMYRDGRFGVARDCMVALQWFQREAAAGASVGLAALADCYAKGQGVKKDFDQSRKLYSNAFQIAQRDSLSGDRVAMCCLGYLYGGGLGVDRE